MMTNLMKETKATLSQIVLDQWEEIVSYKGKCSDLRDDIAYRDKLIEDLKIQRNAYRDDTQVLSESMDERDKQSAKNCGEITDLRRHIKFVEQARDKAKAALVEESAKVRKWKVLTAREILEGNGD